MTEIRSFLIAAVLLFSAASIAQDDVPGNFRVPIKDLGGEKYGIGFIIVDKANRTFTVPGIVAHLDEPLEYLAVTQDGYKDYESLLTLRTRATHFQLACILIGLDDSESIKPRYQFDEREATGPLVNIDIAWDIEEKKGSVPAYQSLLTNGKALPEQDWVFIGSHVGSDNRFMAEGIGSLIGFVHDPVAIIENRNGLGIGAYGGITGNPSLLPPEGANVTLRVSVIDDKDAEGEAAKTEHESE